MIIRRLHSHCCTVFIGPTAHTVCSVYDACISAPLPTVFHLKSWCCRQCWESTSPTNHGTSVRMGWRLLNLFSIFGISTFYFEVINGVKNHVHAFMWASDRVCWYIFWRCHRRMRIYVCEWLNCRNSTGRWKTKMKMKSTIDIDSW